MQVVGAKVFEMLLLMVHKEVEALSLICQGRGFKVIDLSTAQVLGLSYSLPLLCDGDLHGYVMWTLWVIYYSCDFLILCQEMNLLTNLCTIGVLLLLLPWC